MGHWKIIGTLIHKIIDGANPRELEKYGLAVQYVQHGRDVYPHDAARVPFAAAYIQAIEDSVANLTEDCGMIETLSFLIEREIVHFQRFGEILTLIQEHPKQGVLCCGGLD
jgi:spore coat protein JC